jgi:hypothetical protein
MEQWIESYNDSLKQYEITVDITKSTRKIQYNYLISLTLPSGSVLAVKGTFSKNTFYFLPVSDIHPFTPECLVGIPYLLACLSDFCQHLGVSMLFAQETLFKQEWGINISHFFEDQQYEFLDMNTVEFLFLHEVLAKRTSGWLKTLYSTLSPLTKVKDVQNALLDACSSYKQKDPIFFINEHYFHRRQQFVSFYYESIHGQFNLIVKDNTFWITEEHSKMEKEINHIDEISSIVHECLQSIYQKNKIKALLNPPTFHFERFTEQLADFSSSVNQQVRHYLLSFLTNRELEQLCAIALAEERYFWTFKEKCLLFTLGDFIFVCDMKEQIVCYKGKKEHTDKAYQCFETLVMERIQNQLFVVKDELLSIFN